MPSFRAEKSYTNRHLTEYTHVEAEVTDVDFEGLMDGIEDLMKFVTKRFYEVMIDKIKQVYPEFIEKDSSEAPYLRVLHKEAIDFLIKKEHKKPNGECYKQGDDISDSSERFLVKEMSKGRPMFLTNFPIEHKPFYVKRSDSSVYACDLLAAGVGEILGGSMREDDYEKLIEGFEREKINPEPYYWYLDLAKYGPSSHGGWGLGFERLLCTLMSYDHIDKACLYPRKPDRCTP
ncbi:SYNC [Hepatospora eriocheir]|uniref:SYNC n=1 Tax=Hepatospora eriocheir TaxID=1081669 RepID=A0A1X0QGA2_9MICR|nr:SYNC [Hepatospora eriocheir]